MRTKAKQSGVSLMEMVVVIGAVALLGTLSLPAIRAFNKSLGSVGSVKAMISASLASARAIAAKEQKYAGIRFQKRSQQDSQYMIFIIYDPKLPRDGFAGNLGCRAIEGIEPMKLPENIVVVRDRATGNPNVTILFSQSGKLVIHDLWVKKRLTGNDDVFNTQININLGTGMFLEDSTIEASQNRLVIREIKGKTGQLVQEEDVYINPYTGRIIRK